MANYTCPLCGKKHEIELGPNDEYEDYDGLCEGCEAEWMMSPEYQSLMRAMGG